MANPSIQLGTNSNWAVKEDKLLAYKEYNDYFFNKEFYFSRGTSATYVAKDGLIKTAGIQPNIVTNGDFATDSDWTKGSGWSISGGKAVGSATGASLYQADGANYTSGKLYKITFEVSDYVSGSVRPEITNVAGSYVSSNGVFFQYITATSSSIGAELKGSTFTGSVDNVTVQEIQTDTPRIDFTNDTKGHLLLEPSRTNVITYSNGFDDLSWQKTGVNVTANAGISPDGTNNAYLIEAQSSTSSHRTRKTGGPNNTVSVSIFAKKGTTDYAYFFCGGGSKHFAAIFDLSDGSVTDSGALGSGSSFTSASSISLGNGWYRLQVSGSFTTPPGNRIGIIPYYQSTIVGTPDTSWLGSGESIYIYGAMEENNSYSTSYIPTTVATSTRNADVCYNSGSAQDFNDSEGVLYAEIAALANDGTFRSISISSDAGYNNSIMIRYISTSNQINVITRIGSAINNTSVDVNDITEFNKIAFKYKSEDCVLFINGVQVATSAGAFNSSGINDLSFDNGGGNADFYGKVRNVQVFTEALTDSELQELTS